MIPRLQTEQELEDPYAADEEYLREVIAQASPPSPAPVAAPAAVAPSTPFDVFKQNLFTTQYSPTGASPETGADQFQAGGYGYQLGNQWVSPDDQGGYVVNTPTAKEGIYKAERFDASGNKLSEFINDARNTDLQDLAQLATFALGVGPLGGMLGSTVAGALGIPVATATSAGLTAAQLAALGTTVGSAGLGILQGQDPLDVLQNAIKAGATAFLPSQVSSFIPSTGTAALDAALKTATEAGVRTAVNGGDVESAVIGSLVNSGVGAATGATGLPPELVNAAINVAKSGGDPQKIFNAVVSAGPAIQSLQNYYSTTDTGDETARLLARYGTADQAAERAATETLNQALVYQGANDADTVNTAARLANNAGYSKFVWGGREYEIPSTPPTTEDVQQAIINDVLRQSPEQQLAPAGTEVVQQAIQDDLNRELADIVYLNADNAGIKTQQEAAQQASQRGLPGFIFQGKTYRLSQAPGYLSPEGKLYPSEAAYVATLGPKTITIPGIQIAAPKAPVASYSNEARIGLASKPAPVTAAPAAPAEQFVNPAVDFTEAATASQGNPLSADYKPSTTPSDIIQNLRDVRQNIKQSTDTGGRLGLSQLAGTGLRAAAVVGSAFGTAPEKFAEPEVGMDELTAMMGTPPSSDAAVRDVQKELYDYQKSQLAALPNDAQRAFASGVASTVNTALTYPIGGPLLTVANAAANTGNLAWMQGKEAKLSDEDNAKRALFMSGIEGAGEALGIPFLKMLLKEVPLTGSKDALTDWLATKLKALGGENFTEQLTTAGQFAVDRVAEFGIPSQATDLKEAAKQTGISTFASFGGNAAIGSFYGTPGLQTVTTQAPPTPIEFLGSTPATQVVPTEGLPQQLTYQPPAPPPSQVQITGPAAAAPAPEIFGPESQLGFEEGVRPTAQQQLEEALSGVYEPPAPPAPAPTVPKDTAGITPEMVAFIDEEGNLVTYGDLGFTAPAPAAQPAPQTAPQTQPATDAIFAEPQMDEINRLFQEVYQQQNYPVAVPAAAPTAAPTTALTAAPTQQDVIDLAPALTTAAPAQDLSAYQQAINQAVYGGTGEEPATQAPTPSAPVAAPATGTILSTDPTQGTALVVGPNGDTKVVDVSPDSKPGDTVNINAPSQDLSTPVATDPTTGEVITLGDVTPSPAPAPSQAPVPAPAPAPALDLTTPVAVDPTTGETLTLADVLPSTQTPAPAPAPAESKTEVAAPSPAPALSEATSPAPAEVSAPSPAPAEATAPSPAPAPAEAPAPSPALSEAPAPSPAPAPTTTETKTEAPAPAPTETKTEAAAPAPTTTETITEAPAPAPSTTETRTEAPAPAPSTTETKTEAPAPAPTITEIKTEAPAPAPAPTTTETKTETPAPTTQAPTPAPPPPPPLPPPAPAPAEEPARPPATPIAPTPAPPPGDVLTPVTADELRKIVETGGEPPLPPAPEPPAVKPTPAPPPSVGDVSTPATEEELRQIVSAAPPPAPTPAPPAPTPAPPAPTPAPPAPTVKPPVVKPPSPAPSPAAQLAQVPGMTPELVNLVQELMRTDPANLLAFTMVLQEEQEEKLEGLRGKLKSRKA